MSTVPADSDARASFRLATWSWVAGGLSAALWLALRIGSHRDTWTAYDQGQIIGEVFGTILVAVIIAWLAFWIGKRSRTAASVSFVVVLAIVTFNNVGKLTKAAQAQRSLTEMTELVERAKQTEDPDQREHLAAAAVEKLAATKPGLARAVQTIKAKTDPAFDRFGSAKEQVDTDRFFDFERMLEQSEYAWQRETAESYAAACRALEDALTDSLSTIAAQLESSDDSAEFNRGVRESFERKLSPTLAFVKASALVADGYTEVIAALQAPQARWSLDDQAYPAFDDGDSQRNFDALMQVLADRETKMGSLAEALDPP